MVKIMKDADEEIRRVVIIAQQRGLPLTHFLAHDFAPTSFALCDSRNGDLLYQTSKAVVLQFLRDLYPSTFQSSYSCSRSNSAIVIDGGSLLEMRPNSTCRTIRDYARQLLRSSVGLLFQQHVSY